MIDFDLARVEEQYAQVFAGVRFDGTEPRSPDGSGGPDSYVWLQRKDRRYDIAEMSSGEQAVFSILYEFVRQSIGSSIVLIDELELHLHPPEQQRLLASLRRLGPRCQFIVTTHSPYLESVTPNEEEIRLEGGQRCL